MSDESTVIVTGANSGIGLEAARELGRRGGRVVLACRSPERGAGALEQLCREVPEDRFELMQLDLGSLASVRAFAAQFSEAHERLDVLCNNAGVMAIPRRLTEDGFEQQLGVNHLGHFALTGLLLPRLQATDGSRVVTVTSLAHRMGRIRFDDLMGERHYAKWEAYGQSKLANLLFARELQRRLQQRGSSTISVACHPGYAATNLQHVGPQLEGSALNAVIMRVGNALLAQSSEAGARPTVYAATEPGLRGGELIGPGGPGQLWGRARVVSRSSRASRDPQLARRLWEVSEELTGVRYLD
ncbi:MAG: oxidoreductase [Myxococcales bacterium]|jgi:NAD(P)-dependent dehydrogenase (short-subunit alcohol dehydrogenase family)